MTFQRELVSRLVQRLKETRRFIQIVTGPRQTGKTTAVMQAIEQVSEPVLFVSADDPTVISREWLKNLWEQARVLNDRNGEAILVVDEVQKIPDWASVVKLLWDEDTRYHSTLKVVLTGSSSLLLQRGMAEALMGRFEVLYSPHWCFRECSEAFGYTLEEFLYFGGYPGASEWRGDVSRWRRYMTSSIVEPTISQDVLLMEDVRRPALLRALFYMGAAYSAQELSFVKLQGQLQDEGNTATLASYLDLLTRAGILCGLDKFAFEKVRQRKSSPRFMVYDTSLMVVAADVLPAQAVEDTEFRGHLVESAVGAYLLARAQEEGFKVYYWRDRNYEVDFVLQRGSSITALEVKSGRIKGTGGSLEFLRRYPQALCYVVGSPTCSLEDFLSGKIELFKISERVTEAAPVTASEVISVFDEYIAERAASGVLAAQVISGITYSDRKVRATFDPAMKGIDYAVFASLNPFQNLAEFVGTPIAFDDSVGRRLRSEIDSVEALLVDGTSLGALTVEEIHEPETRAER